MKNQDEIRKNQTRFSLKSTSLFKNNEIRIESSHQSDKDQDQINTEIDEAIQNQDRKSLRSLSNELTKQALKKMRSFNKN
ncbi:hypothetical protein NEF87_001728 [Candidatus Lokiarchaeum ossiferum]|uniref:Uncharacterized protein n=1 Tax=Candidatus Lokiarchaeum ossiferum TaxID=2951803 RepID=A0ABY6HPJ6_9ARCH|nr:hypothetical protein NEF87_001728 [Candidatus Lokiarchaeum sp. B-35]